MIVSITLISICLIIFIHINISINRNIKNNKIVLDSVNKSNLISDEISLYERNEFPSLEINNNNYRGVIEIKSIDVTLPVESYCYSDIQSLCYQKDDNIVFIGTNLKDSISSYKLIEVGDKIYFNDMMGKKYEFSVEKIKKSKNINDLDKNYKMIMIVKNYFEASYSIFECN